MEQSIKKDGPVLIPDVLVLGGANNGPGLTKREVETLQLVSEGLTTNQVAGALKLSRVTIESHRKKIIRKLQASNMVQAVADGIRKNLIL